ncbi:ACP phosphodiesterase [Halofilum ochraceum]|uniref:acyl carrier protein phosphodiesterase n=1 Tax=Halofilum ochraceum TaxID=1611323 RepID=UPI0008316A7C|nr:ACP phosphodiesterase [Halofilum ochraceum]
MNYLAHLALADGSPESILGNFLGDFAKGRPEGRFAPAVVRGIRLHRSVDGFTDAHPVVHQAIARLPQAHRRFAGIAIDMAFDHFLAARWEQVASDEFRRCRRHAYAVLTARYAILPPRLQRILPSLREDDWLGSYARFQGMAFALARMSRRLSRENPLALLADDIGANYDALRADFDLFWPDVQAFAVTEGRRLARHLPDSGSGGHPGDMACLNAAGPEASSGHDREQARSYKGT